MIGANNSAALVGSAVVDEAGEKIGSVGDLFVDPSSGQPNWITVKTGFFGTSRIFVPLDGADADGETIRVPYAKDFVKDAPRIDADGPLGHEDERRLYDYYGTAVGTSGSDTTEGSDRAGHDAEQTSDTTERSDTSADNAERSPAATDGDSPRPHGRHVRSAPPG